MDKLQHLKDKQVVFRFVGPSNVYSGKIVDVEERGVWIDSSAILNELKHDELWKKQVVNVQGRAVFFVPFSSLLFLMASQV